MWKVSSRCETGACVEVNVAPEVVQLRLTEEAPHKAATPDTLKFSRDEWAMIVAGFNQGDFQDL